MHVEEQRLRGEPAKKNFFHNFGPISLKTWYYMQNLKRKRLTLSFLRLDHYFSRYSHFCGQKNDFFRFLPLFQNVSPPTIFKLQKKLWSHSIPLFIVQLCTSLFFKFRSGLEATKVFVKTF